MAKCVGLTSISWLPTAPTKDTPPVTDCHIADHWSHFIGFEPAVLGGAW